MGLRLGIDLPARSGRQNGAQTVVGAIARALGHPRKLVVLQGGLIAREMDHHAAWSETWEDSELIYGRAVHTGDNVIAFHAARINRTAEEQRAKARQHIGEYDSNPPDIVA